MNIPNQEHFFSSNDNQINIVDLLLMDHSYLKDCMEIIQDKTATNKERVKRAKSFLDTLKKHAYAETKAFYEPLKQNKNTMVLAKMGEEEHNITEEKVDLLTPDVTSLIKMEATIEAELSELCQIVEEHIYNEELTLLPIVESAYTHNQLMDMAADYLKIRKYTEKDLQDYPMVQDALNHFKKTHK